MRAEIITIGTELMLGRIVDTHSSFLSKKCSLLGIDMMYHTSVGDNRKSLLEMIKLASKRSDLVFLCGGLGPTIDDLTKETLAEFLHSKLIQDEKIVSHLQRNFSNQSLPMPASNYKQSLVFPEGKVFENKKGTAPGLAVTHQKVTYILLPGPTQELIPMFEQSVYPFLQEEIEGKVMVSCELSFFGIGESYLEEQITDLIQAYTNPTVAPYIREDGVTLVMVAKAESKESGIRLIQPLKFEILRRVGEYCFSEKGETLEEVVIKQLHQKKLTVAVAESCTGGLLAHLLTTVPGSSGEFKGGWVCYTNSVKREVAKVPAEVIQKSGAVSSSTAEVLADHAAQSFHSDFALSITGVAGPDPSENKPIGLVYIGFHEKSKRTQIFQLSLKGSRKKIQLLAAKHALFILQQRLKKGDF